MAETIGQWLVTQGLLGAQPVEIMDGFCQRLVDGGFPLARGVIGLRMLHPHYGAVACLWRRGEGGVETARIDHDSDGFAQSPFAPLARGGGGTLRRRLEDPASPRDFPILAELAEAGITDYLCSVVPFDEATPTNGLMTSWSTDRRGGFAHSEIEQLDGLLPLLAIAVKASVAPRIARSLLTIYLGHDAGNRVLAGKVRRGSIERIGAVLYYADLTGFTSFADKAAGEPLIAALNLYLEAMVVPVERSGGQILKFMGDGLLATFALADFGGKAEAAAGAALDAAEETLAQVVALNAERRAAGEATMAADIALHLGDVLYGNVGSEERLDFTVIGPAVNEASRIETLCGTLGRHVLVSSTLAAAAGSERHRLESLGRHRLRGVSEPQEVFGLVRSRAADP